MNTRNFTNALILFFGLALNLNAQNANILYVKPGSNGDGTTWDKAINDLQSALSKAKKGTQIWVAEGMYFPTSGDDRSKSFQIPDGVAVYGGFSGNEKKLAERSFMQHPTLLSGNIGSDDKEDNSFNVIYTKNVSPATVLDGFIVSGGYADGEALASARERSGGAWYNDGSGKGQSNPTIANCTFIDNFAKDGGAIYNNGKGGEASPRFTDCYFENNKSDLDGGAVYNDGRGSGKSNPTFNGCNFESNRGNYGGAIFNHGLNGDAEPKFANCVFTTNEAFVKGGGIFHLSDKQLDKSIFGNSVFNNNSALDHHSDEVHHYLIATSQMAGK